MQLQYIYIIHIYTLITSVFLHHCVCVAFQSPCTKETGSKYQILLQNKRGINHYIKAIGSIKPWFTVNLVKLRMCVLL